MTAFVTQRKVRLLLVGLFIPGGLLLVGLFVLGAFQRDDKAMIDKASIPGKVVPIFSNNKAQMENLRKILDYDGIREVTLVVGILQPIAGEYRQGKSFLLSYLLRYLRDKDFGDEDEPLDGLFDHKKLSEPVTQGISTWNQPISVEVPKDDGSKKEVRKVLQVFSQITGTTYLQWLVLIYRTLGESIPQMFLQWLILISFNVLRFVPRSPNKMSWGYGLSILLELVYTVAAEGPYKITPGSALLLTCSDTKIGRDAYVEWIKDGEDDNILKNDNKYKLSADGNQLNIMDTGPDDAGFYECRTKSPQFTNQFSVFYFNLENMKTKLTVTENDVVELKCLANGKPIPTVQWLKDGKKLNDSKYEYKANENLISNAELSFKNATKKDGGNYTCQVFSDVEPDKHFSTSTYVCVCKTGVTSDPKDTCFDSCMSGSGATTSITHTLSDMSTTSQGNESVIADTGASTSGDSISSVSSTALIIILNVVGLILVLGFPLIILVVRRRRKPEQFQDSVLFTAVSRGGGHGMHGLPN